MAGTPFKDHFSTQAAEYRRFRPTYPAEIFDWLASVSPVRERALDVGTGNGQAAVGLAAHFAEVIATEPSAAQLALAEPHPRVRYAQGTAEHCGLPDASVDLVTAAQAAHWFDGPRFGAEVRRVLRPGGIVAVWTYETFKAGPPVDALVAQFYRDVVGPYWPPERRHVEERYATLTLPYPDIATPSFELRSAWDAGTALDYLGTWSSVARCRKLRGADPRELLAPLLREAWGPGPRELRWPIHLRAARAV